MSNRIIEIPNGGGSSGTLEQALMFAASDETSDLAVGTDLLTFAIPFDITLTDVRAFVVTAPTGDELEVDILKNGVSILSTNITIDAGENNSENAATPPVISDTSLSKDDVISVDLIQVGSTVAGAGLKITLAYEAQANVSGGGGELEYQAEITTSTTLTTQKGLNKVYPVNSSSDIVITVPQGVYSENDVINFERRGIGSVEIVPENSNVFIRGIRDADNRYFINDQGGQVYLACQGSNVFGIFGNNKRDGVSLSTSNYTALNEGETNIDVTVTGTGFSANMKTPMVSSNATLNSWIFNTPTEIDLNMNAIGVENDTVTVTYDNGFEFIDTDAITIGAAPPVIPTGNITHYYKFNGNPNDSQGSINGTDGANANYVSGLIDTTLDLPLINTGFVTIPDNDDFSFGSGSWSITILINPDSVTGTQCIVCKRGVSSNAEYLISLSNDEISVSLYDSGSSANRLTKVTSGAGLSTGNWYVVTVAINNTTIITNVNGTNQTLTDNSTGTYTSMTNTSSSVKIGKVWSDSVTATIGYDGKINALSWWDKELNLTEMSAISTQLLGGTHLI